MSVALQQYQWKQRHFQHAGLRFHPGPQLRPRPPITAFIFVFSLHFFFGGGYKSITNNTNRKGAPAPTRSDTSGCCRSAKCLFIDAIDRLPPAHTLVIIRNIMGCEPVWISSTGTGNLCEHQLIRIAHLQHHRRSVTVKLTGVLYAERNRTPQPSEFFALWINK